VPSFLAVHAPSPSTVIVSLPCTRPRRLCPERTRILASAQYTSIRYTDRLDELGAAPSVGSRGDAYDNAMAEAWVATFKSELVDGRRFPSFEHAEHETLHWIGFYNEERLHEALGDLPPAEYEIINYKRDNTPMVAAT
jgi:putative transposase